MTRQDKASTPTNSKPRKQLSLRFDKYAELLEEAEKYCEANGITVTTLVVRGIRLAMANQQPTQMTSHDKPADNNGRLDSLEKRQAELEEQLAKTSHKTSQDAIAPNSEAVQEIVDQRTAYLATGISEIKNQLESQIQFLKTELEKLKREFETRSHFSVMNEPTGLDVTILLPEVEEELTQDAIAPEAAKTQLIGQPLKDKVDSIRKDLKKEGIVITGTVIKNKIMEMFPNVEDWKSRDTKKDVIRALKHQN